MSRAEYDDDLLEAGDLAGRPRRAAALRLSIPRTSLNRCLKKPKTTVGFAIFKHHRGHVVHALLDRSHNNVEGWRVETS